MTDSFSEYQEGLNAPASNAFSASPSDDADLDFVTRGIYVAGTGNLKVTMLGGTSLVYNTIPAGTTLAIRVSRIWNNGTTATSIIGLY